MYLHKRVKNDREVERDLIMRNYKNLVYLNKLLSKIKYPNSQHLSYDGGKSGGKKKIVYTDWNIL